MKKILLHILFLCFIPPLSAQQMQWASEVVDKSSQYGNEVYSARQALGIPNAINGNSTEMMAWAPGRKESSLGEHLQVRYTVSMRIRQVVVSESKNPGAIRRITLFDDNRKRHVIYENSNPVPTGKSFRFFTHIFPLTEYKVSEVLIELKTSSVPGSNNIDAIGISPNEQKYQVQQIEEVVYEKGVSNAENLGIQINSAFAERLPIISPDGKTLWFARKYHPQNRGDDVKDDIWVSTLQGGNTWSRPINVGAPLNNEEHNFVFSVNPAGDKLWLANEYNSVKKDGISYSTKNGRTWSRPRNVRIDDHYNKGPFVCYSISNDEQVLLMSVTRREGIGENDLYVSFKSDNGEYTKPQSLGSIINTVGDDSSVFLAADGKTIYFSSNGHAGYGGYDMFRSQRLDDSWTRWSKPVNLGKNINSAANDYNYTIPAKGDYAYFSRDDKSGMSDLFRVKLPKEVQPEPVVFISGQLLDANTKQPIGGILKYEKEGNRTSPTKMISDDRGKFAMILPYGENVDMYAERDGYFAISEQIHLAEQTEELDSDGGNPNEPVATKSNSDIDKMQLRLNELGNDLTSLENAPQPNYQKRKEKEDEIGKNSRPYASDPALLDLQRRYEAKLNYSKSNDEILASKSVEEDVDKDEDELTRMKRQYNKSNERTTDTPVKRDRSPVISGKGDTSKDEEDAELAAMKAKFNRHNGQNEEKNEVLNNKQAGVEYFPWQVVEEKTRDEMKTQLLPEVRKELEKELLTEAKEELAKELNPSEQRTLQRAQPRLKSPKHLKARGGTSTNDLPDWAEEIKAELRIALEYEVRQELKKELREEVKAELRQELEYQVKKELEKELRKELEDKIRAELLAEQKVQRKSESQRVPQVAATDEPADIPEPVYKELEKEILLAPIEVGQVIPMNNIFFDSNESSLKSESYSELARVKLFLQEKINLIIEIGGHTNGWCSHVFANELSTKRAKEVREFLIGEGIPADRIQFRGYGKTTPIASNDTKAGRRQNQRVEMKILEIK
ncbi:MAG: OOP family OmpA-OmpF porin [Saprospiraceae bacterium]|jgi:OOP family OmpA-OmpF porin